MLVIALIQMNFIRSDYALQNLGVTAHQRLQGLRLATRIAGGNFNIAGHKDPSLAALELDAIGKISADVHGDAVGIEAMGQEITVNIP